MMQVPISQRLIGASDWLYRLLLRIYPHEFRQEYGPQMAQVFHDCCRDAVTQAGIADLARLWLHTAGDVVATVCSEWLAQIRQASQRLTLAYERSASMRLFQRPPRVKLGFDNFSKRARNVLQLASEEARALGHAHIGTEHLLLGLIRERNGISGAVLHDLGITLDQVRFKIQSRGEAHQTAITEVQPLTEDAVKLIEYAVDEAKSLHHDFVGTEHLLLGLIRLGQGGGVSAIEAIGVPLEQIRAKTLQVLERR